MNRLHKAVHHHLKLTHYRHTGRRLHHKHTSYRGLAVVLVLAGAVMLAATLVQRAAADQLLSVSGVVPVPVPTSGAIISTPASGTLLTSGDNLVAGNCPIVSPQVAVVLTIDGTAAGSAICNANNNFALPVILTPGAHTLVAEAYTITGGKAPLSQSVAVIYQNPKTLTAVQTTQPAITAEAPYDVLSFDQTTAWNGTIAGGTAPYRVTIEWGDGKSDSYSVTTADAQRFTHRYSTLQSYNARIAVADASGHFAQQQYAAVSYVIPTTPATTITTTPLVTPTLAGLYGLFLTTVSVCGIVWLEARHAARQELIPVNVHI